MRHLALITLTLIKEITEDDERHLSPHMHNITYICVRRYYYFNKE